MAHTNVLNAEPIPAAGTAVLGGIVSGLANVGHITAQFTFDYGSGGTSVTAFLQTSLDGGDTWLDIACAKFLLTDAVKMFNVASGGSLTAATTPTDGTLADDTVRDGVIGDRVRVKAIVAGTYVASTLSVDLETKTGVGGPGTVTSELATDGAGSIQTVTLAVTTTGVAGSATGTADSAAIEGYLIDVFVDWDAAAPATSDLLLLYLDPANGQILSVSNSATDDFFMPLMQAQNPSGVDLGIYGRYALNGTIQAQVAQSDALAPAVTIRVRYERAS